MERWAIANDPLRAICNKSPGNPPGALCIVTAPLTPLSLSG